MERVVWEKVCTRPGGPPEEFRTFSCHNLADWWHHPCPGLALRFVKGMEPRDGSREEEEEEERCLPGGMGLVRKP